MSEPTWLEDERARLPSDLDSARRRIQRLERAWAMRIIETVRPQDQNRELEHVDERVAELVCNHAGSPIGPCHACGLRAPLEPLRDTDGHIGAYVCAWGCDEDAREEA